MPDQPQKSFPLEVSERQLLVTALDGSIASVKRAMSSDSDEEMNAIRARRVVALQQLQSKLR